MIQLIGGRYYDLDQLGAEFTLAGIAYTSLGTDGLSIFTYDAMANPISLPVEAVPIIAAHVPAHLERDLIELQLQPVVGIPILDLSPTLLQLLVLGLAYNARIIDKSTLAVLPVEQWVR